MGSQVQKLPESVTLRLRNLKPEWWCRQLAQLEEQKQQLEQYNATIQSEKDSLQLQNTSLTERLEAVVKEKLPSHQFDQETPVDKTLNLLQMLIMVS